MSKAAKRPPHRPAYEASAKDRTMVKVMVAGGILQDAIAGVLGITGKTLRRHFRAEIDHGAAEVDARVVTSLITMATTGKNFLAAKWYTQARMGWSEKIRLQDVPADVDLKTLTDAELEARASRLRRSPAVLGAAKAAAL